MVRVERRSLSLLAVCLGVAAVAGCAASAVGSWAAATSVGGVGAPASAPTAMSTASPPPGAVNVGAFDALARQEAVAWARSPLAQTWRTGLVVLAPADELSSGPSGGFPSVQDKEDFINGDLVFTGPAPSGAPAGVVTWPDGSTMTVPVLSEAQTFRELTSSRQCPACATTPLDVTAAKPTTLAVGTSRGIAKVPGMGVHSRGRIRPGHPGGPPAGQLRHPGRHGQPVGRAPRPARKGVHGRRERDRVR